MKWHFANGQVFPYGTTHKTYSERGWRIDYIYQSWALAPPFIGFAKLKEELLNPSQDGALRAAEGLLPPGS